MEEEKMYQNYSHQQLKLILRCHSRAILGLFQDWTAEDTKNLDAIVHEVYQIMMGNLFRIKYKEFRAIDKFRYPLEFDSGGFFM